MNDRAPGEADPLALETVERIWRERGSPGLVLFGSRAKGRYREDSDIDVMVPVQGRASEHDQAIMSAEMSALAGDIYGRPIHVSAMCMHLGTFLKMRRSVNHIAAIVAREGVALTDNPELFSYDPEDLSMEPLVTRRMRREALRTVAMAGEMLMEHEPDLSVEWAAGRAMHGALSAVISGNLREIGRDRTLEELERRVREMQPRHGWTREYPCGSTPGTTAPRTSTNPGPGNAYTPSTGPPEPSGPTSPR